MKIWSRHSSTSCTTYWLVDRQKGLSSCSVSFEVVDFANKIWAWWRWYRSPNYRCPNGQNHLLRSQMRRREVCCGCYCSWSFGKSSSMVHRSFVFWPSVRSFQKIDKWCLIWWKNDLLLRTNRNEAQRNASKPSAQMILSPLGFIITHYIIHSREKVYFVSTHRH